jgi:hypothetical protein
LTAAVVVMILVATSFANNFLDTRMAENEFSANKQFMLTTGLQVDDIAWTIGRTQTVRYTSRYGQVKFESSVLNYSFEVSYDGSAWQPVLSSTTGIILFNMPTSLFTLGNNYFERIFPSSSDSFLQNGTSAPVTHVFVIQKLPMAEGNYTRVVVAPSIRMLNSTIGGASQKSYFKFYLASLNQGANPQLSQSITLTGNDINKTVRSGVKQVRINVTFPYTSQGYDSTFFNFKSTSELVDTSTTDPTGGSVVEFYVGKVIVRVGLYI